MEEFNPVDQFFLLGLPCPDCGLPFASVRGQRTLRFDCPGGHSVPLAALSREASPSTLRALEDLCLGWAKELRRLDSTAARAERDGVYLVSSVLKRQAAALESRLSALWEELGAAEVRELQREFLATSTF